MREEATFIWDYDSKYEVKKLISLETIIEEGPCPQILIKVIKLLPEEILLMELDPDYWNLYEFQKDLKKFVKEIRKLPNGLSHEITDFLERCGFLKWHDLTEEEFNRYIKNQRRREQRRNSKSK